MIRVAINGFGRIGKAFLRAVLTDPQAAQSIEIVAINTGKPTSDHLGYLFKHDSIMRTLPLTVEQKNSTLIVNGHSIPLIAYLEAKNIGWKDLHVDWVVECTGKFTSKPLALEHIQAGAKKVLISAPSHDADITIIPQINSSQFDASKHTVVSLGSCTTNCLAPVIKVLHENFSIIHATMTTVHAYTNDQVVLDVEHKDPRRARAAAQNIIPTKTGAEKAIIAIYPELAGKLTAHAIRVPVPNGSLIDLTVVTKETTTTQTLNDLFKKAAQKMPGALEFSSNPLVSCDILGNPHGAIIDSLLTQSLGTTSRICAWYDNEFGYASRMKDFLLHL